MMIQMFMNTLSIQLLSFNEDMIINTINRLKMLMTISNVGLLNTGQKSLVPCTPLGCLMLLRELLEI